MAQGLLNPADNRQMSTIGSIANNGLSAIASGSSSLDQEAQAISDPNNPNVTDALVSTTQSLQVAEAGANVINASNQMLGTLLDIFA
jgi:hypothetical protein